MDICPKADSHHPLATSGARDRRKGLQVEAAQSAVTVIFKLIIGGLTRVIFVVLGTVILKFQGPFVPISLRPILDIMTASVVRRSCS